LTIQAAAGGSPKATVACGNQNPKMLTVLVSRMLWWVFWSLQWAFGGPQKATVACGNQNPMNVDSFSFPHGTVGFLEPPGGLWRVPKGHRSMRKPKPDEC
jgi:hypothetical protein